MTLAFHLKFAGVGLIALALVHVAFVRALRWKEELAHLSLLNRQIFYVHTFFICFVLVAMGALSLLGTRLLLEPTALARAVLGGFTAFWALRLICQWFVYDPSLWRGNRTNTLVHWVFTGVFGYLTALYAWAMWR
jgi:hypothetical protein